MLNLLAFRPLLNSASFYTFEVQVLILIEAHLQTLTICLPCTLGYIFAWIGMEKFGRRPTMVASLITAGIALLANAAVELSGKSHTPFFFWFNLVRTSILETCNQSCGQHITRYNV